MKSLIKLNSITRDLAIMIVTGMALAIGLVTASIILINQF